MNLILTTSIVGLTVGSIKQKRKVGTVSGTLFDTDKGLVLGFLIRMSWLAPLKFVPLEEIHTIDRAGLLVEVNFVRISRACLG